MKQKTTIRFKTSSSILLPECFQKQDCKEEIFSGNLKLCGSDRECEKKATNIYGKCCAEDRLLGNL